jgi:CRISPR-associated protein Csm3
MNKRLEKKIILRGETELLTGLHIGGTNTAMDIGGIDKNVIRNPLTGEPILPGSSLKGKMRSLLEISLGELGGKVGKNVEFGPKDDGIAAKLYGNAKGNSSQHKSRIIVRDGHLINADALLAKTEIPYTEAKSEVTICRITSAANPRQMERVPAGARFSLEIILDIYTDEDEATLKDLLFRSLELVTRDYLGGSGSRGYGQVQFHIQRVSELNTETGVQTDLNPDALSSYTQRLTA